MTEPAVTLTDYAVALEGAVLLAVLNRGRAWPAGLRLWLSLFLASVSAASAFGGTVHGFFLDKESWGHAILWPATLMSMGVTALSMWAIGAQLLLAPRVARWLRAAAIIQFVLYGTAVLTVNQRFWIGLAVNLPALLFLLAALVVEYRRRKHWRLLLAAAGPALVLVAGLLQQLKVGIHAEYFNHNALYHVLQAVAVYLLFQGGTWLLSAAREKPVGAPIKPRRKPVAV